MKQFYDCKDPKKTKDEKLIMISDFDLISNSRSKIEKKFKESKGGGGGGGFFSFFAKKADPTITPEQKKIIDSIYSPKGIYDYLNSGIDFDELNSNIFVQTFQYLYKRVELEYVNKKINFTFIKPNNIGGVPTEKVTFDLIDSYLKFGLTLIPNFDLNFSFRMFDINSQGASILTKKQEESSENKICDCFSFNKSSMLEEAKISMGFTEIVLTDEQILFLFAYFTKLKPPNKYPKYYLSRFL